MEGFAIAKDILEELIDDLAVKQAKKDFGLAIATSILDEVIQNVILPKKEEPLSPVNVQVPNLLGLGPSGDFVPIANIPPAQEFPKDDDDDQEVGEEVRYQEQLVPDELSAEDYFAPFEEAFYVENTDKKNRKRRQSPAEDNNNDLKNKYHGWMNVAMPNLLNRPP